jgi:hypothetical protein
VTDDHDVLVHALGGVAVSLDALGRGFEVQRRLGADVARRGQAHVRDDDVRAGRGHRAGLLLAEHVRAGEHPLLAGLPYHLDLLVVAHPRLLEVLPEPAVLVDETHSGEVLDAREASPFEVLDEHVHLAKRVGPVDAREDGRVLDDGDDLVAHLDDDLVGVAVGEQAGERPAAVHSVPPGVVDDEQVDAAALGELRRDARPRSGADHRAAARDHRFEPVECLRSAEFHAPCRYTGDPLIKIRNNPPALMHRRCERLAHARRALRR